MQQQQNLNTIVAALAKKHQISIPEAEDFVNKYFALINIGIMEDKQVKVKGLGTFKVIGVQERESVNVNTGERMVIEGHNKVTFSPDTSLKNRVNKPFQHFETIMLDNGIDINSVEKDSEDETRKVLEGLNKDPFAFIKSESTPVVETPDVQAPAEIPVEAPAEAPAMAPVMDKEDMLPIIDEEDELLDIELPEEDADISEQENITEEDNIVEEEQPVISATEEESSTEEEQVPAEEEQTTAEEEQTTAEEEQTPAKEEQTPAEEEQKENEDNEDVILEDDEEEEESKNPYYIWITASIILIGIAFGGGFYAGAEYTKKHLVLESTVIADVVDEEEPTAKLDTVKAPEVKPEVKPEAKPEVKQEPKPEVKEVKPEPKPEAKKEVKPEAKKEVKPKATSAVDYDAMDARVRTGAYRITGLAQTVKVKEGETLLSISNKFLGPDMICYMEVFNGKKSVSAGETVKIPALELKKKKKAATAQ